MKVNMNIVLDINTKTTKADLLKAIEGIPDSAKMDIEHQAGDRPWESDTYSIEFSWKEER